MKKNMIKLKLTTLTPVFISNGKDLNAFDYKIIGSKFYLLNLDKISLYIFKNDKNAKSQLDNWLQEKENQLRIKPNQDLNELNLSILSFVKDHLRNHNLSKEIDNQIVNGEFSYYKIDSKVETNYSKKIQTCLKTADNKVYIPGSTIKGMIRSALLNDYLQRHVNENPKKVTEMFEKIKQKINNLKNNPSDNEKKKFADNLINEIFVCKDEKDKYDAKFDLMKFIKVSDTNYYDPYQVCELIRPSMIKTKGKPTDNLNAIEVIKPGVEFEFYLNFDIDYFNNVYKNYQQQNVESKHDWKDLPQKFKELFQVSLEDLKNLKNNVEAELFEIIKFSILNFSQFVYELDEKFQEKSFYLNQIAKYLNEDKIVAKIGWGGGYHSKTIYTLNFFNENSKFIDSFNGIFQEIIKKFRIGYSKKTNKEVNVLEIPATRKAIKSNNFYQQMGWIKIEQI